MSSPPKINYLKGIVICHGKSEVCLVRYICTNLHLNVKQFSKNKGRNSIQITSLMNVLDSAPFNSMNALLKDYEIQTSGKGANKILCNFKLFVIMDTDDCTDKQRNAYISKEMFKNHWLYDYIVPIYNIPKLDVVLHQSGILTRKIKDSEKGTVYGEIFPINDKPFSSDTLLEVSTFKEKVAGNTNTNINNFVDYCLTLLN